MTATFKDTRIVNVQSNETPGAGVLHFVIAHRFGTLSSGAYDLWGLDNAQMRMAFDYGISDRLSVGVARNTYQKTYEANVKARVVRNHRTSGFSAERHLVQRGHGQRPEGARRGLAPSLFKTLELRASSRGGRKMSDAWSLAFVPSFVHRNVVLTNDDPHDLWLLGIGGRYKLGPRFSLNGEYHHFLSNPYDDTFAPSLSLGVDIETGGHVFQLHITNARGMFERSFLAEPLGTWRDGNVYFGFNLSRVFTVKS